ncbi:hypothetical protein SERLA73DRAFT_186723 [Serpula lacrymans var. lacrymans S7.3]|uniref:Uncharacterized protein n=2 Tax=Serpula lacrymans var. lacrymans TaxID=341189 RepID=F8Q7T1_SERL3|nr:uncharacterized protein SERLADRAFT_475923 [Serpula lacrymans var. lacrymans S7.9]EGN95619.1 hypothetical protein SERLA73DRAFT_186723 [Serpula lacrymans var. lacrymans S7.3]EGO21146.1 hypothetical protein SERLADRAFT_475923 [Serpula lacrymans var. lacrymans S7.9]
MSAAETDSRDLPRDSTHSSKSVRFVYSALAAVYHDHTPINEWDENDYAYISVLAAALDSGELELSDVRWKGPGHETTKAQRFVAEAVVAQMKVERKEVEERNDEDAEADLNNDHALLLSALNLDDEENPMSTYLN